MSGFDDNPFADPFADPSIQQAVNPPPSAGLDNYDPFSATATRTQSNNQPATLPPSNVTSAAPPQQPVAPPAYTPSAQQQQQSSAAEFQELKRRQEELEKKAQELARREEELRNATLSGPRPNNWPPLPSQCPISPCFYQDINVEIPLEFQRVVRMLYYLWMFHALMLLVNMLGGMAILFSGEGSGVTFGLGLLYLILFTPVSYVCWFRTVYKAFRDDSSFNFMVFFFIFFFQTVVAVISAVGVPSMGSCGWVAVGSAFSAGYIGLGIFLVLVALGATADAGGMMILLLWVHRIYRSTGASFAKAQAEFTQGVMRNEHVQSATANAASSIVRNQFGGNNSANNSAASSATTPTSDPRF